MLTSLLLESDITYEQLAMMIKDPSYLASMSRSTVERLYCDPELQLNVYPSERKFICLAWCQSSKISLHRIRENLILYQLWKENFQKRIILLKGDLEQSLFGL